MKIKIKDEYLNHIKEILGLDLYNKYINSLDNNPTRALRIYGLDKEIVEEKLNIKLENIEYDNCGFYIDNDIKYGNHYLHHLGAIYFQEPSAMMPANLYTFKGDEKVLDLCASPGGKSLQILSKIPNGILVSNEIDYKRSQILFSNIERMGFNNSVITNSSPKELADIFKSYFDVILIDAPCSGEGMFRKDEDARNQWNLSLVDECEKRDKEILHYANLMLKNGGKIIYSTCTFENKENIDSVNYLKNLSYKLLTPYNHNIISKYTYELQPNNYLFLPIKKGEGQFCALLEKTSSDDDYIRYMKNKPSKDLPIVKKAIKEVLSEFYDWDKIINVDSKYYVSNINVDMSKINVVNYGIYLGEINKNNFKFSHQFFKVYGRYFKNKIELNDENLIYKYLRGEELDYETSNGYGVITIFGKVLGGYKASNNKLKNHYPKGLRNFK